MKKRYIGILLLLILALFAANYQIIDNYLVSIFNEKESAIVERIIDGDTVEAGNKTIRLLGINTPERGEKYYQEAKDFLGKEILNKSIFLGYGKEREDKYHRTLAYVFLGEENIDIKIVENGFANYYFPSGRDKYYYRFKEAWEKCIRSNKNLCEASNDVCSDCIIITYSGEIATIKNICTFSCSIETWIIKGEGRKIFYLPNISMGRNEQTTIDVGKQDTLFLRDKENKLVLWKSY